MNFSEKTLSAFVTELSSSAPVPGGGGASALLGALGTALGAMVANLTIGKKKYADVEQDMLSLLDKCTILQNKLLELIDRDAEGFFPLSQAYRLPEETDEEKSYKQSVLERESINACAVPLEIMSACTQAIDIIQVFAQKGSRLALSDAGVGALFCKAALDGASLNVFINTKGLKDRKRAAEINTQANKLLEYGKKAEEIFNAVSKSLQN